MMTKVMPMAMMPFMAFWLKILNRLFTERKPGTKIEAARKNTIKIGIMVLRDRTPFIFSMLTYATFFLFDMMSM